MGVTPSPVTPVRSLSLVVLLSAPRSFRLPASEVQVTVGSMVNTWPNGVLAATWALNLTVKVSPLASLSMV